MTRARSPGRSELRRALKLLLRSPSATAGLVLVAALLLLATLAPWIAPYDPVKVDFASRLQPLSQAHLLGTDTFGRDILSRILWGARFSLLLGAGSVLLGSILGISAGLVSGYVGGTLDLIAMRVIDVFIAFRLLLLAITIIAILGPGLANTMVAIGLSLFAVFTRLSRGEVLAIKGRDHVEAARAIGASSARILYRHVLPNIISPLVVLGSLRLGEAILAEATLSFLGLGPGPPTPSWGLMVNEGLNVLRGAAWVSVLPGLVIMLTVLGFNLLGDGLRDALDPRLRGGP